MVKLRFPTSSFLENPFPFRIRCSALQGVQGQLENMGCSESSSEEERENDVRDGMSAMVGGSPGDNSSSRSTSSRKKGRRKDGSATSNNSDSTRGSRGRLGSVGSGGASSRRGKAGSTHLTAESLLTAVSQRQHVLAAQKDVDPGQSAVSAAASSSSNTIKKFNVNSMSRESDATLHVKPKLFSMIMTNSQNSVNSASGSDMRKDSFASNAKESMLSSNASGLLSIESAAAPIPADYPLNLEDSRDSNNSSLSEQSVGPDGEPVTNPFIRAVLGEDETDNSMDRQNALHSNRVPNAVSTSRTMPQEGRPTFCSLSLLVPRGAEVLTLCEKHLRGGFMDPELEVSFPTPAERHSLRQKDYQMAENRLPTGNGILWAHPSINSGVLYPLDAFDTMNATFTRRQVSEGIDLCQAALRVVGELPSLMAKQQYAGCASAVSYLSVEAGTLELTLPAVVFTQLEVQLRDLDVLVRAPAKYLDALALQDLEGIRAAYYSSLAKARLPSGKLPVPTKPGYIKFIRNHIEECIRYCVFIAKRFVSALLTNLETAAEARSGEKNVAAIATQEEQGDSDAISPHENLGGDPGGDGSMVNLDEGFRPSGQTHPPSSPVPHQAF